MHHFSCFCLASCIIQILSLSNWLKWVGEDTSHSHYNIQCSFMQTNFSALHLSIQKETWNILWEIIQYSAFLPDYINQFPIIIDLQLTLKNQGWITSIKGRNNMKNFSDLFLCLIGQLFPVDSWLGVFLCCFGSSIITDPRPPEDFLCMVLVMSFFSITLYQIEVNMCGGASHDYFFRFYKSGKLKRSGMMGDMAVGLGAIRRGEGQGSDMLRVLPNFATSWDMLIMGLGNYTLHRHWCCALPGPSIIRPIIRLIL